MHFVGLDLAWGERKPTGVAALDDDGRLVHIASAQDDSSILDEVGPFVDGPCLVAIDAPLIVTNETGQRGCETDLNRDFAKFQAGAHPANKKKPEFAGTPRGARIAEALGLDMDPHSRASRRAIEVYPHPATVVLFRLGRTLKYKQKQGRSVTQLRTELLRLMDEIERLAHATVPLRVGDHPDWIAMRATVENAERKSELRRAEDPIDAVVCAYVGLYATQRPGSVTIYGDFATGYIVTPTLPSDLAPTPPEPMPGVVGDAVARYAERRPALVATTENYLALVTRLLDDAGINYLSVTARTKSVASFAAKADRSRNGERLYTDPSSQITDQVGLRVITYLREDVTAVGTLLSEEFDVLTDLDMGQVTAREGRWGYASRHMLIANDAETQPASVQIRTVLQHAWAEFEHDIRYKGTVPEQDAAELDRRFTLAAGLLELADREFTEIRDRLRTSMAEVRSPDAEEAGIATPVLATYLGHRFPEAGWSRTEHYGWMAALLVDLGILTLDALEELLTNVDTEAVNKKMDYRFPAGAVRRLDDALLATFADRYVGLPGNAHRVALLQNRLVRLQGQPS
ncbi:bifunctional ribonuclease/(p)ppGpp synthase [Mycolicibacterium psychrotolerans]|uniref:bifunctional ribonuclease/(p)ppGpp synthase n=1 Tax=Mycolicibacterium psychrotolerans TaxID=216929 RepID=UPI003D67B6A8